MAQAGAMSPDRVINGTYAELYDEDGSWIANAQSFEARFTINRRDLALAGKRTPGYKAMGAAMQGSFRVLRIDDRWLKRVTDYAVGNRNGVQISLLRAVLDDPDQAGPSEHWFYNVKIWEGGLIWSVDEIMEETIPFTFEGYEPRVVTVNADLLA